MRKETIDDLCWTGPLLHPHTQPQPALSSSLWHPGLRSLALWSTTCPCPPASPHTLLGQPIHSRLPASEAPGCVPWDHVLPASPSRVTPRPSGFNIISTSAANLTPHTHTHRVSHSVRGLAGPQLPHQESGPDLQLLACGSSSGKRPCPSPSPCPLSAQVSPSSPTGSLCHPGQPPSHPEFISNLSAGPPLRVFRAVQILPESGSHSDLSGQEPWQAHHSRLLPSPILPAPAPGSPPGHLWQISAFRRLSRVTAATAPHLPILQSVTYKPTRWPQE